MDKTVDKYLQAGMHVKRRKYRPIEQRQSSNEHIIMTDSLTRNTEICDSQRRCFCAFWIYLPLFTENGRNYTSVLICFRRRKTSAAECYGASCQRNRKQRFSFKYN